MEEQHPLWKFLESSFTSGGIGVISGAALTAPATFKYAFIGGGVLIAIGILRANALKTRHPLVRVIGNSFLLAILVSLWIILWKVMPPPTEQATPDQIADAVVRKQHDVGGEQPETPQTRAASKIADAIVKKLPETKSSNLKLRDALVTLTADLSKDILEFAETRKAVEQRLPYLDPTIPEGQGKQTIPAARARDAYYSDTRTKFRYQEHYWQRCHRIVEFLPKELSADAEVDILKRYCGTDTQTWPQDANDLKDLSSRLTAVGEEIDKVTQ